jgi:hypothetical protein
MKTPVEIIDVWEGEFLTYSLTLLQGSTPVTWALLGYPPSDMSIDAISGVLNWNRPLARAYILTVIVQVSNELTSSVAQLKFRVLASYEAKVEMLSTPLLIRPVHPIGFAIKTVSVVTGVPLAEKRIDLWVRQAPGGVRRKLPIVTNESGTAIVEYQPYGVDVGMFEFGADHPLDGQPSGPQGNFSIMGVDVSPSSLYILCHPNEELLVENIFTLRLQGGPFTGIQVLFLTNDHSGLEMEGFVNNTTTDSSDQSMALSVRVLANSTMAKTINFVVETNEASNMYGVSVFVDARQPSGRLSVSPDGMTMNVPRGSTKYVHLTLQNVGVGATGRIQLILPNQDIVHGVTDEWIESLDSDEQTGVTISFAPPIDTGIGTRFRASIILRSDSSEVSLQYDITIVSSAPASLTIITRNEASYFAAEKPNLADALVRVRSLTTGVSYSNTTGPNGTLVFDDLVEDMYEVVAQKLGHKSFRRQIYLVSPGQTMIAFLQFQAVSYTFTVVPVEIVDKYIIDVQADFETFVPMPVVVFDPVVLDWGALRSGLIDEIPMTATNYGLIAAENLTYFWTEYAFNVWFELPDDDKNRERVRNIGTLPANSSVVFPIKVKTVLRYQTPAGRVELRDKNDAYFLPLPDDVTWDDGFDMIFVPESDPVNGQQYVMFDKEGAMTGVYFYGNDTFYELDVDGTMTETTNTTIPGRRRLREIEIPEPVRMATDKPQYSPVHSRSGDERELDVCAVVTDPLDCLNRVSCEVCKRTIAKHLNAFCTRPCGWIPDVFILDWFRDKCESFFEDLCDPINPCNIVCPGSRKCDS